MVVEPRYTTVCGNARPTFGQVSEFKNHPAMNLAQDSQDLNRVGLRSRARQRKDISREPALPNSRASPSLCA